MLVSTQVPIPQSMSKACTICITLFFTFGNFSWKGMLVIWFIVMRRGRIKVHYAQNVYQTIDYWSWRYKLSFSGVCTVYAFLTRKCPDGFNETKHIGFTNYTAIVIWLAFVPLYIASTNNSIRMVTLAMSLSLR